MEVPWEAKNRAAAIPLLQTQPKERKPAHQRDLRAHAYGSTLTTSKPGHQPRCLSEGWKKKTQQIKTKEILSFAEERMDMEDIMLSEKNNSQTRVPPPMQKLKRGAPEAEL